MSLRSADAAGTPAGRGALMREGTEQDNLFTRIGVRPLVNGRGTFTIISGSCSLPQVKQAMYDASFYFVHLDELMEAVGRELGQLTGAEWGIATTGCEAAIALAVVACIAGTDPEKSQALPYVKGRDQVIIPKHSRNPYDFGVRMTGVEVVEVDSAEELRNQLTGRTAMVYILSSPAAESGPLSIPNICAIAREKGVPVFVDAAAEEPLVPNIHLQHGATLVGYSGGKCLRGPQSSGLLIGQKDLCHAAYYQSAPNHNYGRAFKCSKEETMGLLAAVRQWYKRDHAAEQRAWLSWLQHIESRVQGLPSLSTEYLQPVDLSNRSPRLRIRWDARTLKIESPFDYKNQARLYLPRGMPDPQHPSHARKFVEACAPLIEASGGRAFLLFTSYRALAEGVTALEACFPDPVFPVLVQGQAPREALLERFRELGNAVLLATGSFWEGVDVKGEALAIVAIDKLPFASPDDPLLRARLEGIRRLGGNPFLQYQLPQAVLALKQGVGRLIRDFDDFGVIVLGDPRLTTKAYGSVFLSALPPSPLIEDGAAGAAFLTHCLGRKRAPSAASG